MILSSIFVYCLVIMGGTYAYFALTAVNENTVVGVVGSADLDLDVEKVIPTNNGVMVPQLESALGTAISSQYNCADDNGNVVCQVYKATLTNNSTSNVNLNGSVSFTGINNLPNLKWKRIDSATTIGTYSSNIASTSEVIFESKRLFTQNESETYYFVIWIDETGDVQTDTGTFRMTVKFDDVSGKGLTSTIAPTPFIEEVMKVNAVSDASIDFSQTSEESNTNGIYVRSGTENDTNPIYYYRGNVNNNMIFADTCWKIVRTTETGGLKILYNGIPVDNQCNNTGTASQIGTKAFNSSYKSPAYVGYMYSNSYQYSSKKMNAITDAYVYGNSVTYTNGIYTLDDTTVDTVTDTWTNIYNSGLNNNHYTCFSTETTCENVSYIYQTSSSHAYYVTLTGGKKIGEVLLDALGTDDNNTDNYNTISSTIKGNNTTSGTLDYWYYTNIEQKGYNNYIEDTIWCNNRSISNLGGFNPNGGITSSNLIFSANSKEVPDLSCSRDIDKFTVSVLNGNGNLDYPVGLLTIDEVMLAGADKSSTDNDKYYLYSGSNYWINTPSYYDSLDGAISFFVNNSGKLDIFYIDSAMGVRPSISLKSGFNLTGNGDGSITSPYIVD